MLYFHDVINFSQHNITIKIKEGRSFLQTLPKKHNSFCLHQARQIRLELAQYNRENQNRNTRNKSADRPASYCVSNTNMEETRDCPEA